MIYIFVCAMMKGALSAKVPVNEYVAINQLNYPNMMITASGGKVRIKEIAATTFRPYDINVCRLELIGPSVKISFTSGFLFAGYGIPNIKRDYFPHPGFHFNVVKLGDAYKIMLYGKMCLEIGPSVAPSAGHEIFVSICNELSPFQLFNIRKLDIDMSETVRTGLSFGYQLRAVRRKTFYGSDKYSGNVMKDKLTSNLLHGFL